MINVCNLCNLYKVFQTHQTLRIIISQVLKLANSLTFHTVKIHLYVTRCFKFERKFCTSKLGYYMYSNSNFWTLKNFIILRILFRKYRCSTELLLRHSYMCNIYNISIRSIPWKIVSRNFKNITARTKLRVCINVCITNPMRKISSSVF